MFFLFFLHTCGVVVLYSTLFLFTLMTSHRTWECLIQCLLPEWVLSSFDRQEKMVRKWKKTQRKFPRWPVKSIFTNFQRGDFSEQKHFAPHLSGTFMFSSFFFLLSVCLLSLLGFLWTRPLGIVQKYWEHRACESERTVICHLNMQRESRDTCQMFGSADSLGGVCAS